MVSSDYCLLFSPGHVFRNLLCCSGPPKGRASSIYGSEIAEDCPLTHCHCIYSLSLRIGCVDAYSHSRAKEQLLMEDMPHQEQYGSVESDVAPTTKKVERNFSIQPSSRCKCACRDYMTMIVCKRRGDHQISLKKLHSFFTSLFTTPRHRRNLRRRTLPLTKIADTSQQEPFLLAHLQWPSLLHYRLS